MDNRFSKLQLKALSEIMSSIYNTNNTLNNFGVNINNHDVNLFTDSEFNLYVRFYTTIANGEGVETHINYLKIGVLGEKTVLNKNYDMFDLVDMFADLEPIKL
jgi:hypothetical protein